MSIAIAVYCLLSGADIRDELQIDPLLLAETSAVWEIIASKDNPVWAGWDAKDTPILIYIPSVEDVLINHPKPPEGFVPYRGSLKSDVGEIFVKRGPTLIDWDGQNTSKDVNGVVALVVADTVSNRRMSLRGLLGDPRPHEEKLAAMSVSELASDPYKQMLMIAHEAFHVFQTRSAPRKGANERNARLYPCLSVNNNIGLALEGKALAECLRAENVEDLRRAAVRWLAIRRDRRAGLAKEVVQYEDGNEFLEGLAVYVEWRMAGILEGRVPVEGLRWAQGFRGLENLSFLRDEKLSMMLKHMRGEVNVNNDPYGTSPVRSRFYFSGMAIAAMLDRLGFEWKGRILQDGTTLTGLAEEAFKATTEELQTALAEAQEDPEREKLVEAKTALESAGRADTTKMLEAITAGPNTGLVVDYSAMGNPPVGLAFTPFGVRAVDDDRTIYTLVPIEATIGSARNQFKQSVPTPTLEDRKQRYFQFQLTQSLSSEELASRLGESAGAPGPLDAELPGVRLKAQKAEVTHEGRMVRVKLLPGK